MNNQKLTPEQAVKIQKLQQMATAQRALVIELFPGIGLVTTKSQRDEFRSLPFLYRMEVEQLYFSLNCITAHNVSVPTCVGDTKSCLNNCQQFQKNMDD